ncbi:MAG TPA: PIN domain-containing protein [Stellaceae bacterium]|nr:PIN domain-containing protein [Stellaceae bacterium]
MNYLLDTNACIALIDGKPPSIRAKLEEALAGGSTIGVSSVVAFELWYGVAKSTRQEASAERLATFFAGPIQLIAFDDEDARSRVTRHGRIQPQ